MLYNIKWHFLSPRHEAVRPRGAPGGAGVGSIGQIGTGGPSAGGKERRSRAEEVIDSERSRPHRRQKTPKKRLLSPIRDQMRPSGAGGVTTLGNTKRRGGTTRHKN